MVNPEEIHSDLDIDQAETLILNESRWLGLEKHEGLTLQGVKITFEKINRDKKKMCKPTIDDKHILHIQMKDTSLISGVKHYFAKLVNILERCTPVSPFLIMLISFIYPTCIFSSLILLVGTFFISSLFLSIVFGPILFTVFVLPSVFWISFRIRKQNRMDFERRKSKLAQVSLFTNENETLEYLLLVSSRNIFGPVLSFAMYLMLAFFLSLVSLFGYGSGY